MSDSHNRQMALFVDNPNKYLDTFSGQFENEFMKLLRRRCGAHTRVRRLKQSGVVSGTAAPRRQIRHKARRR